MDNRKTDIKDIIVRYLDGSASLQEKSILLQWLKSSDANRHDFTQTRDLWLLAGASLPDNEVATDIALEQFREKILRRYRRHLAVHRSRKIWYGGAAALFVLVVMSFWFANQNSRIREVVVVRNQLITAGDSKGRFILPDGSVVWLNRDSKLAYPEQFQDNERVVTLEGEAYFEVAENSEKPFIVQSGEFAVKVLGTAFDVSNYPSAGTLQAVLVHGSVEVTGTPVKGKVALTPDQMFVYDRENNSAGVYRTNAMLHIGWINDRLVFDNDCLADIIVSMKSWYNVRIECPEAFARKTRLSFTIRRENPDEIMKAMSAIIPIRYSIQENEITIIPK
jgi:ferric-dicitrate binding protein FerR (iron transport regulator)